MPWFSAFLTSTLLMLMPSGVESSPLERMPEYRVKAQFITALPPYVQWPLNAEPKSDKPSLVVGVLGDSPFGLHLLESMRDQQMISNRATIQQFKSIRNIGSCQMLFICASERERLPEILQQLGDRPVLTICDFADGARDGVMVNLVVVNRKVRMEFNRSAAKARGIDFSSNLLKLATNIY